MAYIVMAQQAWWTWKREKLTRHKGAWEVCACVRACVCVRTRARVGMRASACARVCVHPVRSVSILISSINVSEAYIEA